MPRREIGFSKGLVTDAVGVDGALLQLEDGWIDRAGEIRKRGGKYDWGYLTNAADSCGFAAGLPNCVVSGALRGFAFADQSGDYFWGAELTAGSTPPWTSLSNRTGLDNAGANVDITTGTACGTSYAVHNGELLCASSSSTGGYRWSGSLKAVYSTGTIAMTTGSATVTGSGTTWSGNVEAGMYLVVSDADVNYGSFRIKSVESNTSLTLDFAPTFSNTISGASYAIRPVGAWQWGLNNNRVRASHATSHNGRVIIAGAQASSTGAAEKYRIRWSALESETNSAYLAGVTYFGSSAYLDVAPGVGGATTFLASFRGQLIVGRENGIAVVRGGLATDGTDLGASVEVLSDRDGAHTNDLHNFCVTPEGVVFANKNGAFICDGTSVRSMTDGVIGVYWRSLASANQSMRCFYTGRRIIFELGNIGGIYTIVYDVQSKVWSTQSVKDAEFQTVALITSQYSLYETYEYGIDAEGLVSGWDYDYKTSYKNDAKVSSRPRLKLTTHPVPLGDGACGQGRVNNVYVNGYVTDAASDNPVLRAYLLYGRKGLETGAVSQVSVDSTIAEGTEDVTTRLPVDGVNAKSAVRLRVEQSGASSDARIYGLAIDYEPANVIT